MIFYMQYTFTEVLPGGNSEEIFSGRFYLVISVKWRIWWSMLFGNHRKNLQIQNPLKDHMELEIIWLDTGIFVCTV